MLLGESVGNRKEIGQDVSGGSHRGKRLADLEIEWDAEMGKQPRKKFHDEK